VAAFSGQLAITSDASPSPLNVPLSGTGGAPGLQFSPASVAFAATSVGTTSAPQAVTLTNTGNIALDISSITISGDFAYSGCGFPLTLAPGTSCTFSIAFSPQVNGAATGSIRVSSNGPGSPNVLPLSGTGVNGPQPAYRLSPLGLAFAVRVGTQAQRSIRLFSTGSAPLGVGAISASGAFFSQANDCPPSLAVGTSCVIIVTYAPTAAGTHSGQLTVHANASPAATTVSLVGNAVASLPAVLSVASPVDFGQQIINTLARQTVDLNNTGEQALEVSGITVAGAGFRLEGGCASIPAGGTCRIVVVFEPVSIGIFTGVMRIASNDPRGLQVVELVGQSIAAPRAEIELSVDGFGFGNQMITTPSVAQTVTVRSVGTAPLHLGTIAVTGPFFLASNVCGATLEPGAECQLSVGFLPSAVGPAQGQLTVESDAAAGRSFTSLTGTGCRFYSVAGMRNLLRLCSP